MPILLKKDIENGQIGLWKITEEIDELLVLAYLSVDDTLIYSKISAQHRKKEWLATRVLLKCFLQEPQTIKYHSDGRPFLENGLFHVSITHSTGFVAIILHSKYHPGIDIELTTREVGRIARRFLSSEEFEYCTSNDVLSNQLMLLHWCAKEAIFKMIPYTNIEFAADISIIASNLTNDSGSFQGIFNDKTGSIPINLNYLKLNEVLIVWGLLEAPLIR